MSTPAILRWDQAYNRNGDGKLPRTVVNALRTYMNNDTLTGWVSQETLARDTGLDESNVRRQIKKNADAGWLVVTKRGRAGRASEYRLTYPQPCTDARLDPAEEIALTGQICTVGETDANQANTPGYTSQPGEFARLLPGEFARPTSPGTSPQEKFLRETETEDDPFASEPEWLAESRARGERADRGLDHATAAGASPAPFEDPFGS